MTTDSENAGISKQLGIKKSGNVSPDVHVTVTLCEDWSRPTAVRIRAKFEVSSFNRSRDIRGVSLELTAVRIRAKFDVSSFNRLRDIRGVSKFQK